MMRTQRHRQEYLQYNAARLGYLARMLDELHTAASEDRLEAMTPLTPVEVVGWLREFIYTAHETIAEIEQRRDGAGLKLVK
jgi:hypothetical protein